MVLEERKKKKKEFPGRKKTFRKDSVTSAPKDMPAARCLAGCS